MRKNLTEIVFILDRSGSMSGLERDTIGGFNSMIEQQKKAEGEALISTVLFDNVSEVLHDRVNVKDIRPMTDRDYTVRGCTALLDAIGGAIHHIGNVHKYARPEDVPEHTMFVITKTEKWLPAAEVHGEGVFIEFNRDSIDAWLRDPELGALSQKYAQCYKEFCESKEWTVTTLRDARYVLMHTFAHLLIKQMSMSSGYSSSAIRERIYFGDDMSGVLLYTGSADKEGSLGGLVELGNIDQLIVLMKDAFQEALVCTNDPECLNNVPAGNNSNGAACHSCCMISETACENGNRMLDRGLIVPIDGRENQSYFKTLVEELCQLEV